MVAGRRYPFKLATERSDLANRELVFISGFSTISTNFLGLILHIPVPLWKQPGIRVT